MDEERVASPPSTDDLSPADELAVDRILMWLVVVPFTLPMWFSLRRRRPDLAARVAWAAWLNAAQSVLVVVVVALAWWAIVALPSLVDRFLSRLFGV